MTDTVRMGAYSYGNVVVRTVNDEGVFIEIGKFCSIAWTLNAYLGGNHDIRRITTYPFGHINRDVFPSCSSAGHPVTNGSIFIGNDVWVCSNTTVMSGVHIGNGAVIAANSHVIKDVPAYSITGGNPARHIRYRFDPDQIAFLERICWWDWDIVLIDKLSPSMCSSDWDAFVQKVYELKPELEDKNIF